MKRLLLALALLATTPAAAQQGPAQPEELARARAILDRTGIIDGHNDVPWQLRQEREGRLEGFNFSELSGEERTAFHTDLARLKQGGVSGVFWSVYVPATLGADEAVITTLEQIDVAKRLIARHPEALQLATTAAEAERAMKAGRIASFLGAEGGHSIGNRLALLRRLYDQGVRYMTLTHSLNTDWADSATDEPKHGGLTDFGREVVREMNRLGMLVDLSHVTPATMADAIETSAAPVIFSHSSAFAQTPHPRNVPDEILRRLPRNGGVVMVTFVPPFVNDEVWAWSARRSAEEARLKALNPGSEQAASKALEAWEAANPAPLATVSDVADHIDHIRKVAGIDHIGIGSDYDGITTVPQGLEDASTFPNLFAELLRRGYSEADLAKIAQGNILRVMRAAEAAAQRLQRERRPSEAVLAATPPAAAPQR